MRSWTNYSADAWLDMKKADRQTVARLLIGF